MEGEILRGLARARLLTGALPRSLPVASRTDRGVSARANALVVDSPLPGRSLLRALNGIAPDIFFSAAHAVDETFNPRHATSRTYWYLEPDAGRDLRSWQDAGAHFVGRVDVRTFGRAVPTDHPTWRAITQVSVVSDPPWIVVRVTAPAFVWGMVRKIVAAIARTAAGELALADLDSAIEGRHRLTIPLAAPEGLILWDVRYPFEFSIMNERASVHQRRFWEGERLRAARSAALVDRLGPEAIPTKAEV